MQKRILDELLPSSDIIVRKKRRRGPKKTRAFAIKGHVFFVVHAPEGDKVFYYSPNEDTLILQAQVPTEQTIKACRKIIQLVKAESAIKSLRRPEANA